MDHGGQVEVLAKFLRSSLELGVANAVYALLDADDLLHDVDALLILPLSQIRSTFFCRTSHLLVSCVIFSLKSASIRIKL